MSIEVKRRFNQIPQHLDGPTKVSQEHAQRVTVGNIVRRYSDRDVERAMRGGPISKIGEFIDIESTTIDFHRAQNTVARVNEMFAALPSAIRSRFDNDPLKLVQFAQDPANREEGIKLGIFRRTDPKPAEGAKTVSVEPVPAKPEWEKLGISKEVYDKIAASAASAHNAT